MINDHLGQLGSDYARAERDDLSIVASACSFGRKRVVALRRADSRNLVGSNRHANSGAADEYSAVKLTGHHRFGNLDSHVRIKHRFAIKGAKVLDVITLTQQVSLDHIPEVTGGLITSNCNFHIDVVLTKCAYDLLMIICPRFNESILDADITFVNALIVCSILNKEIFSI